MACSGSHPVSPTWLSSGVAQPGDLTIDTDVSNRSQSWDASNLGDCLEPRILPSYNIKRWDGAMRACASWDKLSKDSELWSRDGNCLVHLYGKGQSRRGPSFKVALSVLLDNNCQPLLNRYLVRDVPVLPSPESARGHRSRASMTAMLDIYIPPPPLADKKQILDFYLTVRNFFAWIHRRSVVGQHLGSALISLMDLMAEFRSPDVDNVADMMSYLDEEGYLCMANQPIHALGVLHFAESLQMRDLYIDAFAHCAGMGECLYMFPEYQCITSLTRKLLRGAQADLEHRLSEAAVALRNLLEDDLSESNLGLTTGGRAHLERFRTFLHAYYTHRLGYYPPSPVSTQSHMWDADIYRSMREDFEALYEFLVDRSFTTIDDASVLGQGGICALQTVHTFDLRRKYQSLPLPLPLLPEVDMGKDSRRLSFFAKQGKLEPDQRLVAHAALVKATNGGSPDVTGNALVMAYKRFEEDSIYKTTKFDKNEKLSLIDGRKIRWILIYGIYQTLRSCTEVPAEVQDTEGVKYSLAVSTDSLPPWKEAPRRVASIAASARVSILSSAPSLPACASAPVTPGTNSEIQPDIDYFTLTHRDASSPMTIESGRPPIPHRTGSLSKAFRRRSSLRMPLERASTQPAAAPFEPKLPTRRQSVQYREIVVRGYGNGTKGVQKVDESAEAAPKAAPAMADRSSSIASSSSASSGGNAWDSSTCNEEGSWSSGATSIPDLPTPLEKPSAVPRRQPSIDESVYSVDDEPCAPVSAPVPAPAPAPPPLPRRSSRRKSLAYLYTQHGSAEVLKPAPLFSDAQRWSAIEEEVHALCDAIPTRQMMATSRCPTIGDDGDVPEWDYFMDVGGLTVLPPVRE